MPAPPRRELAAVFGGGLIGALARAGLEELVPRAHAGFPWATLLANLAGAVVLGWALVHFSARPVARRFTVTGFCGGLTTFSALQLELLLLLDAGRVGLGALYVGVSIAGGLAGLALGRRSAAA